MSKNRNSKKENNKTLNYKISSNNLTKGKIKVMKRNRCRRKMNVLIKEVKLSLRERWLIVVRICKLLRISQMSLILWLLNIRIQSNIKMIKWVNFRIRRKMYLSWISNCRTSIVFWLWKTNIYKLSMTF